MKAYFRDRLHLLATAAATVAAALVMAAVVPSDTWWGRGLATAVTTPVAFYGYGLQMRRRAGAKK